MSQEEHESDSWLLNEEAKRRRKPVLREEYNSDQEEILSQIRNLQMRVNALERKEMR